MHAIWYEMISGIHIHKDNACMYFEEVEVEVCNVKYDNNYYCKVYDNK